MDAAGSPEEVPFERGARRVRPSALELASYLSVALLGLLMLVEVVRAARMQTVTWGWTWGVITVSGSGPVTLPGGGPAVTGLTVNGPNPIAWLLLLAALEAYRTAWVRSHVWRVTRGAVEVERGVFLRRREVHAVPGEARVEVVPRGLRVLAPRMAPLLLLGLDAADADAVRERLAPATG